MTNGEIYSAISMLVCSPRHQDVSSVRKPTAAQTEEKTERQTKTKGAKNQKKDIIVAEEIKKGLLPENIKFHLDSIREDPEQVI